MNANAANASIQQQSPMFIFHSIHDRLWRDAEHVAYVKKIPVFPQPVVSILKAADDKGPFQSSLNVRIDWQKKKAVSLEESLKKLHDQLHMIRTKLKTSEGCPGAYCTLSAIAQQAHPCHGKGTRLAKNWDLPTRPIDIKFRERVNYLINDFTKPHKFKAQLARLEPMLAGNLQQVQKRQDHVVLDDAELYRLHELLHLQQEGLQKLTKIMERDIRDLRIMQNWQRAQESSLVVPEQ